MVILAQERFVDLEAGGFTGVTGGTFLINDQ
jgi:hypothetical protein